MLTGKDKGKDKDAGGLVPLACLPPLVLPPLLQALPLLRLRQAATPRGWGLVVIRAAMMGKGASTATTPSLFLCLSPSPLPPQALTCAPPRPPLLPLLLMVLIQARVQVRMRHAGALLKAGAAMETNPFFPLAWTRLAAAAAATPPLPPLPLLPALPLGLLVERWDLLERRSHLCLCLCTTRPPLPLLQLPLPLLLLGLALVLASPAPRPPQPPEALPGLRARAPLSWAQGVRTQVLLPAVAPAVLLGRRATSLPMRPPPCVPTAVSSSASAAR